MAVLQAELITSNGYLLNTTSAIAINSTSSNGYLLDVVFRLSGELINGTSNISQGLMQFLSYLSPSNGYILPTLLVLTPQLNSAIGQYQPYLSSLARFFGENAKQTVTHIQINKADIQIQPLINNTAESLLVGILLRNLQENNNSISSNVYVSLFSRYVEQGDPQMLITSLIIRLYSKVIYEPRVSLAFDRVMVGYSNIVKPSDFAP